MSSYKNYVCDQINQWTELEVLSSEFGTELTVIIDEEDGSVIAELIELLDEATREFVKHNSCQVGYDSKLSVSKQYGVVLKLRLLED